MPASASAADRNLLFGILAVQLNFIGKDALISAMNAWVLDKQKPLGQILLDQKALAADTHQLLDALVQKHLAMHDGDAEKSLAAVSSVSSIRNELRQVADADVQWADSPRLTPGMAMASAGWPCQRSGRCWTRQASL